MSNRHRQSEFSRRSVLKTTGAALVTAGLTTAVGAADSPPKQEKLRERKKYERLCQKHRDGGDFENFKKVLENNGFSVVSSSKHHYDFNTDEQDDGGVDTESFPKNDLSVSIALFEGNYQPFGDISWEVTTELNESGDGPKDNITLGWTENQFLYDGENHSDNMNLRTRDGEGAVWTWADGARFTGCCDSANGYATAYLLDQGSCNDLKLYGTWEHTWSDVSVNSISFGSGGVSVVYSDTNKRWKKFPSDKVSNTC